MKVGKLHVNHSSRWCNSSFNAQLNHARSRPSPPGNYGNRSWCVLCISKHMFTSHVSSAAFSTYERELNCVKCSLQTLPRIPDFSHLKALEHPEGPIPQDVIYTSAYVTVFLT